MTYTSHADLGGQPGHGGIQPDAAGELFHAAWEPRALAITLAMGGTGSWNIDMSRSARETLPGYIGLSYYEIWVSGLRALLAARGLLHADELNADRPLHAPAPVARVLHAADVPAALARGAPTLRQATSPARFSVGQRVRTRAAPAPHHTRLPGYARGKVGAIARVNGMHVFADSNAQGLGEDPQWLYTVAFDGAQLWAEAAPGLSVSIDAWEPYLEAVA